MKLLKLSKRFFAVCLTLGALVLPLQSDSQALDRGDASPDFTLTARGGEKISLSQFRGKVVYLDFWASWCEPCKKSLPWLAELQKEHSADNFQVVTINLDAKQSDAERLLKDLPSELTVAFDPEGKTPENFGLDTMPSSYIIDKSGKVASVQRGFHEETHKEVAEELKRLLAE